MPFWRGSVCRCKSIHDGRVGGTQGETPGLLRLEKGGYESRAHVEPFVGVWRVLVPFEDGVLETQRDFCSRLWREGQNKLKRVRFGPVETRNELKC